MTDREQTGAGPQAGGTGIDLSGTVAVTHDGDRAAPNSMATIFGLKDVSVRYGDSLAVSDVSIDPPRQRGERSSGNFTTEERN